MTVQAIYSTDDVEITFTAELSPWDYGVPESPTYYEVDDDTISVHSIEMFGCDVTYEKLPKDLQAAILDIADELEFE